MTTLPTLPLKSLTAAQVATMTAAINAACKSAGILVTGADGTSAVPEWMFQPAGWLPIDVPVPAAPATSTAQPVAAQPIASPPPTYYLGGPKGGNDSADGKTAATAWATVAKLNGLSNATVYLAAGQTFAVPAAAPITPGNGLTITTDATHPATIQGAAMAAGATIGPNLFAFTSAAKDIALANLILDSVDGNGFAGIVRGSNISINVSFKNLAEGFDWQGVNGVVIPGGSQIGTVKGRCHYFLGCTDFNISGGTFGPSVSQSPIRFSTLVSGASNYNNQGGTIANVTVQQAVGGIACYAVHNAIGISFSGLHAINGAFSFDGAGDGVGDIAKDNLVDGLMLSEAKLELHAIAFDNKVTNITGTNSTGECISLTTVPVAGNSIEAGTLSSPKHGVQFYVPSDTIVSDITYHQMGNASAPLLDGQAVAKNNGGNNKVVNP